jgi:hypothetical protein
MNYVPPFLKTYDQDEVDSLFEGTIPSSSYDQFGNQSISTVTSSISGSLLFIELENVSYNEKLSELIPIEFTELI